MTKKVSGALSGDFPPKLSRPALRALEGSGLTKLADLSEMSEEELLKLHGLGPKGLQMLREALAERGATFRKPARL